MGSHNDGREAYARKSLKTGVIVLPASGDTVNLVEDGMIVRAADGATTTSAVFPEPTDVPLGLTCFIINNGSGSMTLTQDGGDFTATTGQVFLYFVGLDTSNPAVQIWVAEILTAAP